MNHPKVAILRFFKRSGASLSTQSVWFSSKNRRRVGYLGLTASKIVNPIYLDAFVPLKHTLTAFAEIWLWHASINLWAHNDPSTGADRLSSTLCPAAFDPWADPETYSPFSPISFSLIRAFQHHPKTRRTAKTWSETTENISPAAPKRLMQPETLQNPLFGCQCEF